MSWKKKLKDAYAQEMDYKVETSDLSSHFGIATFKPKKYHNRRRIVLVASLATALSLLVLTPFVPFLIASIHVNEHASAKQESFDAAYVSRLRQSSVEALNSITYEDHDFAYQATSEQFNQDVNRFAALLQNQITEKDTYLYSPYTAYLNIDLASLGSRNGVADTCVSILGAENVRQDNVIHSLKTNFYTGKNGSAHAYQGAFFNKTASLKEGYVDKLTSRNAEVYRLDMDKDLSAIPSWANGRVGAEMLHVDDLNYDPDSTLAYYLSLLEFQGKWATSYNEKGTKKQDFTTIDQTTKSIDFMTHDILFLDASREDLKRVGVYDYGDYVSAYDSYKNGYTIQYLTPKNRGGNIFEMLANIDFFTEDPSHAVRKSGEGKEYTFLRFHVPKFSYASSYDITPKLKKMGLSPLYDDLDDSLGGGLNLSIDGGALSFTKQLNSIEFGEDGTIARSITFSMGFGASTAASNEMGYLIYEVTLDEAFVYVIRDPNGLPLFVGAYNG